MNRIDCMYERASQVCIAVAMLFMAPALMVIGVTVWPVLGLVLSIPIFIAALAFRYAQRSEYCAAYT
jgi:hypothetical protein